MTPIFSDPALREAYAHGRTQGRLTATVHALTRIRDLAKDGKQSKAQRLLEIEMQAIDTLKAISIADSVIEDV